MPLSVATHNGPFHADDVLSWTLLRTFLDPHATVVRTRDPARLNAADVVFDVGAVYDPQRRRFDHHQASYTGPYSSAGMVLTWLEGQAKVSPALADYLRKHLVDYVDDVDNGRVAPKEGVPCFARMVDALNQCCTDHAAFDDAFLKAGQLAEALVTGLISEQERIELARTVITQAMAEAEAAGRRVLFLDKYIRWKPAYFEADGAHHPSDYVLFPSTDGSWRVVAIPPAFGSFDQKRPLPEAWAGLVDDELEAVTGVPGAVFCHKNRFIAVFKTREGALQALKSNGLM